MSDWIEWNGGECPVTRGVLVDVRYRDGVHAKSLPAGELYGDERDASVRYWLSDGYPNDIVAYRLHQPEDVTPEPVADGGWIKCADRMPDEGGSYLCWDGRNVDVYQLARNQWVANHFGQFRVTHWQPLPAPPEGEE